MENNNKENLHLLDDLIKKSMNQEVDFSNVEYMYEMMHLLENDLKKIFSEVKLDIKEMEAILLLTQARLQYLLRWFLKYKSFCDVKELEKIFPLVLESYLHNQQIPKTTIDHYLDLCNSTSVNDYDEDINCFDYERWEKLQHQWYNEEIKKMSLQHQEIASLDYPIYESLFDFMSYWVYETKEKKQDLVQHSCIRQIQANIFSILWVYEDNKEFYYPDHKIVSVPRILEEIERIKDDILFIKENFCESEFRDKIENYINLNLLSNLEYIKLFWRHEIDDEPVVILYMVDLDNDRLAVNAIDIFADRKTRNITEFYKDVIEIVPIPTVQEINTDEYGKEFHACYITKREFEQVWNLHVYDGALRVE